MAEEYLQAAFEIKAACDDISRKLLRWHWEQKPGAHSVDALLKHLAQRQKESPDYYERLPELSGRTSWQQLDTTLCMRVLLDPEKDAARPLDLLGDTPRPAAARRACNAVRMARNEAAHASDKTAAAQAALRFNEAVEELEAGYEGTALTTGDLRNITGWQRTFWPAAALRRPSSRRKRPGTSRPAARSLRRCGPMPLPGSARAAEAARHPGERPAAAGRPPGRQAAAARPRPAAKSVSAPRAVLSRWCCWPSFCWACWSGHGRWD